MEADDERCFSGLDVFGDEDVGGNGVVVDGLVGDIEVGKVGEGFLAAGDGCRVDCHGERWVDVYSRSASVGDSFL